MSSYSPNQIPDSVKEKFWSRVDVRGQDECWEWMHTLNNWGYGDFRCKGFRSGSARFALTIVGGLTPTKQMYACHSCDNRKCCNPAHLRWASAKENSQDMVSRGRNVVCTFKTHCRNGHEMTGDNVLKWANGKRACKTCTREYDKRRYRRLCAEGKYSGKRVKASAAQEQVSG